MKALWERVVKFVLGLYKAAFSKQPRSSIMSNGTEQETASAADQRTRNRIAFWVTLGGMVGVTILSIVVIRLAANDKRGEASQLVFGSLLPLLGTWVGTVLAFYFAKANYESAANHAKDLLGITERLRSTPVESVMLKMTDPGVTKRTLVPPEKPESLKIAELLRILRDKGRNRLPVLNADGSLVFVIHLSVLTDYISTKALSGGGSKPVADLTFSDVQTDDAQLYQQILAWACVRLGATLAEAKSAMEDIPGCSDVFVTTAGRKSDPVVGWLTNVEIGLRSSA